jgi:serine/threonine-protein phosphatase 5
MMGILRDALNQHLALPNVLSLSRPRLMDGSVGSLTVCGDLLGDMENLLHIFSDRVGGFPSAQNPYVFTGNVVDKGAQSFETLVSLLLLKLSAPDSVHLLRGAHETTVMNSKFGFEEQILRLYDDEVLVQFRALFCALPVAAVLDRKVFVVHGGVGRETSRMTLAQMNSDIRRNVEPAESGPLSELLWTGLLSDLLSTYSE